MPPAGTPTRLLAALGLVAVPFALAPSFDPDGFAFELGDRVCLIGGTLAERMQHDGWLEARLQTRLPGHELTFRNLGFSADALTVRQRTAGFGSQDEWLTRCEADVVFAFFGTNESFAGPDGIEQFTRDLTEFVRHTRQQKYAGKSAARLVLFSPIAHEDLGDDNLPNGRDNNDRFALYSQTMSVVARAEDVPFVDLFKASRDAYATHTEPLTSNGVFLNSRGNEVLALAIEKALFGNVADLDPNRTAAVREAVVDKNTQWFHRYRTTDGFNVYGGRSNKRYAENISNYEVLQREMQVLDVMTANRDRKVQARANGRDVIVDDSNTPPFIAVKTNRPGPNPDGSYDFLSGEAAIEKMTLADGLQIELFASEEQFEDLINPVQMAFDTKGRLWVAAWPSYTHTTPKEPLRDALLIFEDVDGDGRADRRKAFANDLHNPTGFEFWNGGVLVAQAPDLVFLKDTDGDDVADVRERVLHGISSGDTHHTANSFVIGPGGALYFQEGTFHMSQIESPYGPVYNTNGCVWRFDPRTWDVDRYVPVSFANPHGHAFDRWGQDIVHDGTGAVPHHALLTSGHLEGAGNKHPGGPKVYNRRTRPCPGTETLSSAHFPDEYQQNLLVENVIGFLGILRYRIDPDGGSFTGTELEPIVQSSDPNFRPTDLEIGPDGALYLVDWHNPLIGHLQHHIRDPSRDNTHGRIYRITHEGRPLTEPVAIDGEPIETLVRLLAHRDDRVRYRARIELSERDSDAVVAAARAFVVSLDAAPKTRDAEHHVLEILWLHQQHNVVDALLLRRVLRSPDHRARAAATRVLRYWNTRVPNALELLAKQANDENALVRCEAVVAASFFRGARAAEVALEIKRHPTDQYLDFALGETLRQLDRAWRDALAQGEPFCRDNPAALDHLLGAVSTRELIAMPRSDGVYAALLARQGVPAEHRREALDALAKQNDTSAIDELIGAIERADRSGESQSLEDLAKLCASWSADELATHGDALGRLAATANDVVARKAGYAALLRTPQGTERVIPLAERSLPALHAFLGALAWVEDRERLEQLYPLVLQLTESLPPELARKAEAEPTHLGRFVRIELPRRGTLTLAEVEVFSAGRNIAKGKPAKQSSTAYDGPAARAVDGNTNGAYGTGASTHTRENTRGPWWEVDLGAAQSIEKIVVWNRTDGSLGDRLAGFQLTVLDSGRRAVWSQDDNEAPNGSATFEPGGDPAAAVHAAAIDALVRMPGREPETFRHLATLVGADGAPGRAAVAAIASMDLARLGDTERRSNILRSVLARAAAMPQSQRHLADFAQLVDVGQKLAATMPGAARDAGLLETLRASIPKPIDPAVLALGKEVYSRDAHCITCHQADGKGLANQYPPLIDTRWIKGDSDRLIKQVLHGLWGEITVKGVKYSSPPLPPMIPFKDMLNDEEIAAVLTYVRNAWGNRETAVSAEDVARVRAETKDRTLFWKPEELLKEHPFK